MSEIGDRVLEKAKEVSEEQKLVKKKKKISRKTINIILIVVILLSIAILLLIDFYIGYRQRQDLKDFKIAEKHDTETIDVSSRKPIGILTYFDRQIPIYYEDPTLAKGASLIAGSDMFDGKKGSTSLLASHSGMSISNLFNDLHKLDKDMIFKIKNKYGEEFEYKIFDKKIVEPKDVKSVYRDDKKNIVVLMTCYPRTTYAKRLLVYGERVKFENKK